jgi:glucose/arabinose dehydrogenase
MTKIWRWGVLLVGLAGPVEGTHSLRFYGTGSNDVDRVKIRLDAPARPVDVGGDFTIEFWMQAAPDNNGTVAAAANGDGWIAGNTLLDRDVFGSGDWGDWGIALGESGTPAAARKVAFGCDRLGVGRTIVGVTDVGNGQWHHVAVTRRAADGRMQLFVNGILEASGTGPTGDLSYRDGRATSWPDSDPFLVLGAEKHDADPSYPSYRGFLDELRISNTIRYSGNFTRPVLPFSTDPATVALYHFDEGTGNRVRDESGAGGGPSHGTREFGGAPAGPVWATNTPFNVGLPAITSVVVATGIVAPTGIHGAGNGSGRVFLLQQNGLIKILSGTNVLATPFLDIGSQVLFSGEQGLLGLAFDPQFATNGHFYVYHTQLGGNSNLVARYTAVPPTNNVVSPATRVEVISLVHTQYSNHNGGALHFGPDGYLYLATGDGGGGCDPLANSQDTNSLLGKLLRLNVTNGLPYQIPASNPFVGEAGRDEIWAWGLRNPWRFSFDRLTGDLLIADVGQSQREEVNLELADFSGGANYGWKCIEGTLTNPCATACAAPGMTPPVIEYTHVSGRCSITGGYRYRGREILPLRARYVYGDYCTAELFLATALSNDVWATQLLVDAPFRLTTFGEDDHGEIYYGLTNSVIYKLLPADGDNDQLPDWWEQAHFGNLAVTTGAADSDGDGQTNAEEYRAGTQPLEAQSVLRVQNAVASPDGTMVVSFASVSGKRYQVEYRDDLLTGVWQILAINIPGTGGPVTVEDPAAAGQPQRFYRVRLLP